MLFRQNDIKNLYLDSELREKFPKEDCAFRVSFEMMTERYHDLSLVSKLLLLLEERTFRKTIYLQACVQSKKILIRQSCKLQNIEGLDSPEVNEAANKLFDVLLNCSMFYLNEAKKDLESELKNIHLTISDYIEAFYKVILKSLSDLGFCVDPERLNHKTNKEMKEEDMEKIYQDLGCLKNSKQYQQECHKRFTSFSELLKESDALRGIDFSQSTQ